jgi:hypothetical protein
MSEITKFCPNCGTSRASQESIFCSNCGKPLDFSDASIGPESTLQIVYEGLTQDQVKVLKAFETELTNFVNDYEISPIEIEDHNELDVEPVYLFSKVEYYASGGIKIDGEHKDWATNEMLMAGLVEGAIGVYPGKKPFKRGDHSQAFPYTTIIFCCADCEGDGCEKCDEEGEILYSATWDENGVSFTRD